MAPDELLERGHLVQLHVVGRVHVDVWRVLRSGPRGAGPPARSRRNRPAGSHPRRLRRRGGAPPSARARPGREPPCPPRTNPTRAVRAGPARNPAGAARSAPARAGPVPARTRCHRGCRSRRRRPPRGSAREPAVDPVAASSCPSWPRRTAPWSVRARVSRRVTAPVTDCCCVSWDRNTLTGPHCSTAPVAAATSGRSPLSRSFSVSCRLFPVRCRNVAPWLCPWSLSTTRWYGRGARCATRSSEPSTESRPCKDRKDSCAHDTGMVGDLVVVDEVDVDARCARHHRLGHEGDVEVAEHHVGHAAQRHVGAAPPDPRLHPAAALPSTLVELLDHLPQRQHQGPHEPERVGEERRVRLRGAQPAAHPPHPAHRQQALRSVAREQVADRDAVVGKQARPSLTRDSI